MVMGYSYFPYQVEFLRWNFTQWLGTTTDIDMALRMDGTFSIVPGQTQYKGALPYRKNQAWFSEY